MVHGSDDMISKERTKDTLGNLAERVTDYCWINRGAPTSASVIIPVGVRQPERGCHPRFSKLPESFTA